MQEQTVQKKGLREERGRGSAGALGRAERAGRCDEEAADAGSGETAASRLAQKKKVTDTRNGVIVCNTCERDEFGCF